MLSARTVPSGASAGSHIAPTTSGSTPCRRRDLIRAINVDRPLLKFTPFELGFPAPCRGKRQCKDTTETHDTTRNLSTANAVWAELAQIDRAVPSAVGDQTLISDPRFQHFHRPNATFASPGKLMSNYKPSKPYTDHQRAAPKNALAREFTVHECLVKRLLECKSIRGAIGCLERVFGLAGESGQQ